MSKTATTTKASVIPTMRYKDSKAAVDWLCNAFGFKPAVVVPTDDGSIVHAQLVFGTGMIMIGQARDDEFGRLQKCPSDVGGATTQSAYVIVDDADEHYARAIEAGAKVAYDIRDEDYGGRGYSCFDLEGHLWNFGTYDPWSEA